MTASELIDKLKKYPPDTRILIDGYEGGYNDILNIGEIQIVLNAHKDWWYGAHESLENLKMEEKADEKTSAITAISLTGENINAKTN